MGGRAATRIPKIPSPASNHQKNVIFMDPTSCENKVANQGPAHCVHKGWLRGRTGLGRQATSLRLPPSVHAAREGPSPRA